MAGPADGAGLRTERVLAAERRIGYVAQRPVTDPMGTGRENLVLLARLLGFVRQQAALQTLVTQFGRAGGAPTLEHLLDLVRQQAGAGFEALAQPDHVGNGAALQLAQQRTQAGHRAGQDQDELPVRSGRAGRRAGGRPR